MTICSWDCLGNEGITGEKGCLVSTEQVILSLFYEIIIWWTFTENKHIFTFFCPFREIYPHIFSSNFLATNFPIAFLSSPWSSSQTIGHSYELVYNSVSGHLLFHAKWTIRCIAQSSAYLEEFLSSVSLGVPWKGATMLQLSTFGEYLHIVQNHQ